MLPNTSAGVINKNLSWEETNQYDVGLDISLLDYRFKVNLDYYYRYTKGQLNRITLPGNTQYLNFQWQNGMAISNQGIELELIADIFRETAVQWRMKFNLSRNWNRFEKSADGFDFNSQIIGRPLHQLMVFKTDGFYNSMDEVPKYYTANKEVQLIYDNDTRMVYLRVRVNSWTSTVTDASLPPINMRLPVRCPKHTEDSSMKSAGRI